MNRGLAGAGQRMAGWPACRLGSAISVQCSDAHHGCPGLLVLEERVRHPHGSHVGGAGRAHALRRREGDCRAGRRGGCGWTLMTAAVDGRSEACVFARELGRAAPRCTRRPCRAPAEPHCGPTGTAHRCVGGCRCGWASPGSHGEPAARGSSREPSVGGRLTTDWGVPRGTRRAAGTPCAAFCSHPMVFRSERGSPAPSIAHRLPRLGVRPQGGLRPARGCSGGRTCEIRHFCNAGADSASLAPVSCTALHSVHSAAVAIS